MACLNLFSAIAIENPPVHTNASSNELSTCGNDQASIGVFLKPDQQYEDSPDISQTQMLSILLLGCMGSICFFMGTTMNLASAYYVRSIRHRLPLHNYLVSLFLWDIALLLISWILYCLPTVADRDGNSGSIPATLLPYLYATSHVILTAVILMNLAISVERFLIVQKPEYATHAKTSQRFKLTTVFLLMSTIGFNFSRYFEMEVITCCSIKALLDNDIHDPVTVAQETPFAKPGTVYYILYKVLARSIFVTIGPVLGTATLTILTVKQVTRSSDRVSQSVSLRRLFPYSTFIIIKFVICHGLCAACDIVEFIAKPYHEDDLGYFDILRDVTIFLIMFHSATDGALYLRDKCAKVRELAGSTEGEYRTLPRIRQYYSEPCIMNGLVGDHESHFLSVQNFNTYV